MKVAPARVAVCAFVAIAMTGCATTQGGFRQSALERSIGVCLFSVAIGALAGAAIANRNNQNKGKGALIGAGVGSVACGVLIAINNEQDKQRIRDAQLAAVYAGSQSTQQFVGQDGQTKVVQTSIQEVPTPPPQVLAAAQPSRVSSNNANTGSATAAAPSADTFVGPCRKAKSAITAQGQTAELDADLYCRTAGGDWKLFAS